MGSDPIGFGIYDRCFRSMIQKIKMDWAIGQIIYRHGRPFLILTTTNGSKKDVLDGLKLIKKLNRTKRGNRTKKALFKGELKALLAWLGMIRR